MSRDNRDLRKDFYNRDRDRNRDWARNRDRDRDRDRDRNRDYHSRKRSRSPPSSRNDRKRSRSPRKNDKDLLDENILSEIAKLPEPSELWDNQFPEGGFTAPPPNFTTEPPHNFPPPSYQQLYSGIYEDFPPAAQPPDMAAWNQMSLPPPPTGSVPAAPIPPAPPVFVNVEEQIKKEAAIESEMRHQKAALSKQREDYIKKAGILKKELDTLKDQRNELRGDAKRSPSPDTKRFLKENTKLQLEIQNKLKTIYNVVDMLNGIIGEEPPAEIPASDDSPEKTSKRKSRSPSANKKFNYVYYDPEMHWCRVCNEFPPTAKDYLNHLHSPAHQKMAAAHMEAPWHTVTGVNEGYPSFPSAPTKRTPIKGLQFFVPSTAWYCKLCDQFIGDLHCASAHLKSVVHTKNYTNFVEQNPHWETDWMSDRQKAFEKSRAATKTKPESKLPQQYAAHTITFNKDGFQTKRKDSPSPTDDKKKKDKKKKKKKEKDSSSSSSSESSSSDESAKKKSKKETKKRSRSKSKADAKDEKSLTEWMSHIQMNKLNDSDRKLLNTLKSRIKKEKDDDERSDRDRERSISELTRKMRESERRGSRSRDSRSRDRSRWREGERRERERTVSPPPAKKPEIKKMPFIGKMPVYKHLGKIKTEDDKTKKDEQKKKEEEEESNKKRREEMDAEIQKKVAEFKQKIAQAQLDKQTEIKVELPPPGLAIPIATNFPPPAPLIPAPQPPQPPPPPQPTLPKDFQEALDIIFPTEVKNAQELAAAQGDGLFPFPPGFPIPGMPFPQFPLMQPQMFGFDLNAPLFQPRPQLYDTHVPLVPNKPRQKRPMKQQHQQPKGKQDQRQKVQQKRIEMKTDLVGKKENAAKNLAMKEAMDELALLGIDASDVGAGI